MNPATNQRAQRRDRTNVCMCHLDHLLQLPWAHCRRMPPTEAVRPMSNHADMAAAAQNSSNGVLVVKIRQLSYAGR